MLLAIGEWRIRQNSIVWTRDYSREGETFIEVGLDCAKVFTLGPDTGAPEMMDYLSSLEHRLDDRLSNPDSAVTEAQAHFAKWARLLASNCEYFDSDAGRCTSGEQCGSLTCHLMDGAA